MAHRILWAIPASMLYTESQQDFPAIQMVRRGLDLLKAGRVEEAARLMQEALEVARRGHHSLGEGLAALALSNIYWGTGRAMLAANLARRARQLFQHQKGRDQRHNEAVAIFNLALVHHLTGAYPEALNEYYEARQLLTRAREYWEGQNDKEQVGRCDQLERWIEHLMERLIASDPQQRTLTLFLSVGFADGATATLWGEYARDISLILDGKTLRATPLQEDLLVLTADCCVFRIPPEVRQELRKPSGPAGEYVLAHPGDPLPGDPFYIALDSAGIGQFIRESDKKVIAAVQNVRIIGGLKQQNYRPIALFA